MKEYASKNREKFRRSAEKQEEYNTKRREKYALDADYREKMKEKVKEYQSKNPDVRKAQRIKKYNLSVQDFKLLMKKQNGSCAICGYSDTSDKNFFPVIDHCHQSEKVRGLLCMNCNMALGKFKDSQDLLEKAIIYLNNG
jgi:long-subunit acyl-CoA synthetase (AMP-forming)